MILYTLLIPFGKFVFVTSVTVSTQSTFESHFLTHMQGVAGAYHKLIACSWVPILQVGGLGKFRVNCFPKAITTWLGWELNPRPPDPESDALTTVPPCPYITLSLLPISLNLPQSISVYLSYHPLPQSPSIYISLSLLPPSPSISLNLYHSISPTTDLPQSISLYLSYHPLPQSPSIHITLSLLSPSPSMYITLSLLPPSPSISLLPLSLPLSFPLYLFNHFLSLSSSLYLSCHSLPLSLKLPSLSLLPLSLTLPLSLHILPLFLTLSLSRLSLPFYRPNHSLSLSVPLSLTLTLTLSLDILPHSLSNSPSFYLSYHSLAIHHVS